MFGNGKFYRDLENMDLTKLTVELTPEEAQSPYAKYYHMGAAAPDAEVLEAGQPGNPMDPEKAIMPKDLVEWVNNSGVREIENGYCITPEGYGYATSTLFIPTVPQEVQDCYRTYRPEGDLQYKVWYPGAHVMHLVDGAIEDMGSGIWKINFFRPVNPAELGIQNTTMAMDAVPGMLMIGRGRYKPLLAGDEVPFSYMMIIKQTQAVEGGMLFRTVYWNGIDYDNGEFKNMLVPGNHPTEEEMRGIMLHSAYENANTYALMYRWYEDNK